MENAYFLLLVVELSNVLTSKMEPITLHVKITILLAFLMGINVYHKSNVNIILINLLALIKD